MLGVGMGYAAEPLLEDLKTVDPVRHGEAVVRSAEFFNCNPNLAGLALGATARAEYEAVPGPQIARLRTALCSPLGALGDELFWAGLVPALMRARAGGGRCWAPAGGRSLGFLVLYNLGAPGHGDLGAPHGSRGRACGSDPRSARRGFRARSRASDPWPAPPSGLAIPVVAGW